MQTLQTNLHRLTRHRALLALVLLPATAVGAAAQSAFDLSDYRTVATAATTEIRKAASGPAGQAGYLGIVAAPDQRGRLTVQQLDAAGPAGSAGVQVGDLLLRLDDKTVKDAAALRSELQSRPPGTPVELQVERNKKKLKIQATLAAVSRPLKIGEDKAFIGLTMGELDGDGVRIRRVGPGTPAEKAGVKDGDLLIKLDGAQFNDPGRLELAMAERSPGDTISVVVRRDGKDQELKVTLATAPPEAGNRGEGPRLGIWRKDLYRLAVVCVEYPDVKHNPAITTSHWSEQLFSKGTYVSKENATGQPVYGSLNDHYIEQSCGALRIEGKVFDWVQVAKNRGDYSQGTASRGRSSLLTEALDALVARDGEAALEGYDGVFFLYAGAQFPTTRGGIYWPHRSSVSYKGKRWPYFIVSEGGPRMTNISVFSHEFGHMLGLPDLYARPENPGSEGLGNWCLMSNQINNGRPQHMSAWCKEQLGWLKPAVIDPTVPQKLILSPIVGSTTECFKVLIRRDGSEYLLLENRTRKGFDGALPAEGLLIWRVVGNRPILDESHGVEGPAGPRVYATSVPYPSNSNNAYTPYTTPSSRSQLGGGLPVYITNIRKLPDGRITFMVGYEFS